jgi:uncharacterized membrane protein YdbT with pleckstrin-like domain
MTSYVESSLTRDEKVLLTGKPSLWNFSKSIFFGVTITLFVGLPSLFIEGYPFKMFWLLFGPFLLVSAYLRYKSIELAVTNQRVIAKFGFIRRRTIELKLEKIESLQVDQGILGRMLNFGSLRIAGTGGAQAPIPGITAPMEFKKDFNQLMEDLAD